MSEEKKIVYYAVRAITGPGFDSKTEKYGPALFCTWSEARAFIHKDEPREYEQFGSLIEALEYAFGSLASGAIDTIIESHLQTKKRYPASAINVESKVASSASSAPLVPN